MNITDLVWNLFVFFLPGVLTTILIRYITTSKNYSNFYFIIYSAVLGIGNLIFLEFFMNIYNLIAFVICNSKTLDIGLTLDLWDSIFSNGKYNKNELLYSYIIAIPYSVIISYIIQKKWVHKILKKLKLTKRYGDEDVWSYFLYSEEVEWIIVSDKSNSLSYYGYIQSFSDSGEKREIMLTNVDIYRTADWEHLYSSNAIFLEFESGQFSLELPRLPITKELKDA